MQIIYELDPSTNISIPIFEVQTLYTGCSFADSLFAGSLECFYNLTCMRELDQHMDMSLGLAFNFTPLNPNLNSPQEKLQSIFENIMVDSWSVNVSFASYYQQCAPRSCTFEKQRHLNIFLVITTIIGVFGGLSLGLKIFFIILLRLIEQITNDRPRRSFSNYIRHLFNFHDHQQLTHRLHFILCVVTLCYLYILSVFTPRSVTVQIIKPSLSTYQDLSIRYHNTIQCPCSQVSIAYGSFLTITPHFHEICSSEFISDRWIHYIYQEVNLSQPIISNDFRYSASSQFQLLAALCRFAQETVTRTLIELATNDFINVNLLSNNSLHERIQLTINQLETTASFSFLNTLSLVRETMGANKLFSGPQSSWIYETPNIIVSQAQAYTTPLIYDECNCGWSSKCVQSSRGMYAGCYAIEALLRSTLICLTDQQCIDSTNNFRAMNLSSLQASRFHINTTIESIVNQLFVEEYSKDLFYENYFNICASALCTYSYTDKVDVIEGITFLIGLYGGLIIICRVIAIIIVKLFCRQTSTITPNNLA